MPSFTTVMFALIGATAVMALPQLPILGHGDENDSASSAGGDSTCARNTKQACCATEDNDGGLIGNVLGASCLVSNIIAISSTCPGANVFCCPTSQSGLLDLSASCIPISA